MRTSSSNNLAPKARPRPSRTASSLGRSAWRGSIALGLLLASAAVSACKPKATGGQAPPSGPMPVGVVTVRPATVPVDYDFIGQTDASQSVEIRARIKGFLQDWRQNFMEGAFVQKDQILFKIDPREFEVALNEAEANLQRAQARQQRADREVTRLQQAVATSAAAQRELDDAVTEHLQAQADVRLQKSTMEARQLDLSYTTVRAPLDGVVGRAMKDVGSLVDDSQNSLLATVAQLDPMYAYFSFSERDYVNFRQDVEAGRVLLPPEGKLYVEISLIDGTPYPYAGEINFSEVRIDAQTGSAKVRAQFFNPPYKGDRGKEYSLKPGQFIKGKIVGWVRPNTIAIPQSAVTQGATGTFVYVVADRKATIRPVKPGQWAGADWIILDGLSAGDQVIVDHPAFMMPNAPVAPNELPPATQPATRKVLPTSGPADLPQGSPLTRPVSALTQPVSALTQPVSDLTQPVSAATRPTAN